MGFVVCQWRWRQLRSAHHIRSMRFVTSKWGCTWRATKWQGPSSTHWWKKQTGVLCIHMLHTVTLPITYYISHYTLGLDSIPHFVYLHISQRNTATYIIMYMCSTCIVTQKCHLQCPLQLSCNGGRAWKWGYMTCRDRAVWSACCSLGPQLTICDQAHGNKHHCPLLAKCYTCGPNVCLLLLFCCVFLLCVFCCCFVVNAVLCCWLERFCLFLTESCIIECEAISFYLPLHCSNHV